MTFTVIEQTKIQIEKSLETAKSNILLPIKGHVISLWLQDQKNPVPELDYRIRFKNPKGKVIGNASRVAPLGKSPRLRTITAFNGLLYSPGENGYFWFIIEHKTKNKWKTVAKLPFWVEVEFIEQPSQLPS